jgi:superfamily II RNA helicase
MKIFLTVSRSGMKENLGEYQKVLEELRTHNGHVFATFEEFPEKLNKLRDASETLPERKFLNDRLIRKEIAQSDAVVIEASYPSFRLGFEAFYALTVQKPVLVLSKTQDYSSLIDQPHFFGAKYSDFTLADEIEKYLRHVKGYNLRSRFNLFISAEHKDKVAKAAKRYGVSMSDYIRKLIEEDVEFK